MRRRGYVPLRRRWVSHLRLVWDVVKTYWWDVVVTSSWDAVTTFQENFLETYHWDVLVTLYWDVVGCFIWDVPATSLGCTERPRYDVATTSCCQAGNCNRSVSRVLAWCEKEASVTLMENNLRPFDKSRICLKLIIAVFWIVPKHWKTVMKVLLEVRRRC